ncbi:hypothetical protein LXL04_038784 [Taraxacum kok-saghyz]
MIKGASGNCGCLVETPDPKQSLHLLAFKPIGCETERKIRGTLGDRSSSPPPSSSSPPGAPLLDEQIFLSSSLHPSSNKKSVEMVVVAGNGSHQNSPPPIEDYRAFPSPHLLSLVLSQPRQQLPFIFSSPRRQLKAHLRCPRRQLTKPSSSCSTTWTAHLRRRLKLVTGFDSKNGNVIHVTDLNDLCYRF